MLYQNQDLTLNKFFVKNDYSEIITDISQLSSAQLNSKIYFRPSNCPLVNVNDVDQGTCFETYIIPTGSYFFQQNLNKLSVGLVEKNISLCDYIDIIYDKIKLNIIELFKNNQEIIFCYSGGIDSIVILSYILNLGLLDRVTFAIYNNKISKNKETLFYNTQRLLLTQKLIKDLDVNADWVDINQDALLERINYRSMEHVKSYATSCLFDSYKNSAFVTGYHGNQVLLHKYVFWDEIRIQNPDRAAEIKRFLDNNSEFYTSCLKNYDLNSIPVPIEKVHMLQKPWDWFNGINGNYVHSPLGDQDIFQLLRSIDFNQVPVDYIADATVAREIIRRNVGDKLDQYIEYESLTDNDSLAHIEPIAVSKINPTILEIPENLNHSSEGLQWIQGEVKQSRISGYIAFNSLMCLKTLQWISSSINQKS